MSRGKTHLPRVNSTLAARGSTAPGLGLCLEQPDAQPPLGVAEREAGGRVLRGRRGDLRGVGMNCVEVASEVDRDL
jgi:hypothetical protein